MLNTDTWEWVIAAVWGDKTSNVFHFLIADEAAVIVLLGKFWVCITEVHVMYFILDVVC